MAPLLHWIANTPNGFVLCLVAAILVGAMVYELPTVMAWNMGCKRLWVVALLNILLGWTVIVWIALLVWSLICGDENGKSDL